MSEINIGALKQFQAQWGPVLDAIPAVLEMAERRADIDRAMAKYVKDVERVRASVETEQALADKTMEGFRSDIAALQSQKAGWEQELSDFRKEAEAERAATEQETAALASAARKRVADITARAAGLEAEYTEKRQRAQADHAVVLGGMSAEVEAMEATRVKTEKALAALRAKLE